MWLWFFAASLAFLLSFWLLFFDNFLHIKFFPCESFFQVLVYLPFEKQSLGLGILIDHIWPTLCTKTCLQPTPYLNCNIPSSSGDVIILGPSRVAPAECRQIFTKARSCPKSPTLETGDVFNPSLDNDGNASYVPYPRQMFEVLQAPARAIVKTCLESSEKR